MHWIYGDACSRETGVSEKKYNNINIRMPNAPHSINVTDGVIKILKNEK